VLDDLVAGLDGALAETPILDDLGAVARQLIAVEKSAI
jgi:hypothetical protein